MSDEPLRVTVGSDGRVEVAGCGLVLALEPEDGQVSVLVFGGDVLLGHLRLARWVRGCAGGDVAGDGGGMAGVAPCAAATRARTRCAASGC